MPGRHKYFLASLLSKKDRSSCDLPTTVGGHDLGETAAQLCSERVLLVLDFPQKETFLWVVQK